MYIAPTLVCTFCLKELSLKEFDCHPGYFTDTCKKCCRLRRDLEHLVNQKEDKKISQTEFDKSKAEIIEKSGRKTI